VRSGLLPAGENLIQIVQVILELVQFGLFGSKLSFPIVYPRRDLLDARREEQGHADMIVVPGPGERRARQGLDMKVDMTIVGGKVPYERV